MVSKLSPYFAFDKSYIYIIHTTDPFIMIYSDVILIIETTLFVMVKKEAVQLYIIFFFVVENILILEIIFYLFNCQFGLDLNIIDTQL